MKRTHFSLLPPALALIGLSVCCVLLWNQTARFRRSVETIAEDVRVSLIDLNGKVIYDSTGQDLPNHSARAEFEAVKADGKPRSVVRESETLHMAMFYHARRVGDYVLRIAVPYQAVTDAKAYAERGLLAAIGTGALIILALFLFTRRRDRLIDEMHKLEEFRRDFISNVTHEIRTPVTGILGALDILTDESMALGEQERAELHKVLRDQSVRLNVLVEDVLSLARLEKAEAENQGEFTPCNITDIVQTVINLAHPQAMKAGVTIDLQPSTSNLQPLIRPCDPRLIESAVSNLVQNALRHSGSKTVEIRVERTAHAQAAIHVIDHGIGIPPACQPRLFERFYRVDKDRSRTLGGTGLGLSIVKHIAQLHHGDVTVRSAPGEGATFTLSI